MLKGVNLTLMIGPVVPVPAPQVVINALTSVEVTTNDVAASVFQLTISLSNKSPLHTLFLLTGGQSMLFMRVVIVATVNCTPQVLIDGVITNHQVAPGQDAGHSSLVITGEDLTALMNQKDSSGFPFPALPAEGRVALLLLKYAALGVIPLVIPSVNIDVPIPTGSIPSQQGTDLAYMRALADKVGYVFYLDPGPRPGLSKAYWGPRIKLGVPQPALNADMDAHTNVESLSFNFDSQKNKIPTVFIYNENTKSTIPIPIPPITPLNPALGLISPLPTSIDDLKPVSDDLSKYSAARAVMIGLAKASLWAEAVTGEGTLDVSRYGRLLKARQLVGVRGVGPAFDGLHYVTSVTHRIKRGEYKQSFKLSRNGLLYHGPDGGGMSSGDDPSGGALRRYYGKYRGTVVTNVDPEQRGRIQANVPDVLGLTVSSWALPCVLLAGTDEGTYAVPQMGAAVWIEFEQGDPDFPIWTGGFWGSGSDVPKMALGPPPVPPGQNIVVQTTGGATFVLSDALGTQTAGGLILKTTGGAMIVVNDTGVYIKNGKGATIELVGKTVNINSGALSVT